MINKRISQKLPLLEDFLLFLTTSNYSKLTIRNYERDLIIFDQFLSDIDCSFSHITKKTIIMYQSELLAEQRKTLKNLPASTLSAKTINRMLTSIRTYLTYLIDNDYSSPLLPQHIKLMKLGKKVIHLPSLERIIEFIESPQALEKDAFIGIRNRTVLELIFASGMRISEVISLQLSHIERGEDRILIKGKGNKERYVYLTPRSLHILDEYMHLRGQYIHNHMQANAIAIQDNVAHILPYIFITKKTIENLKTKDIKTSSPLSSVFPHISANYIQEKLKKYRLLLGFSEDISPHTLRHGFATYLAESGASPVALKTLLGHESLETTTKYVHTSDNFAQAAHEDYHPLKK